MLDRLKEFYASLKEKEWFAGAKSLLIRCLFVCFVAYILASVIVSFIVPTLMQALNKSGPVQKTAADDGQSFSLKNSINYHEIRKAITDRNIFNRTGEFPPEANTDDKKDKKKDVFDKDAPCEASTLKVSLVGMIYLEGDRKSVAIIKEEGYESSDIYAEGDFIIGNESAQIVNILRSQVVINNNGVKECLDLKLGHGTEQQALVRPSEGASPESTEVSLDAKYVTGELGEGFGKIIQAARLVPNIVNNVVNGFKMFGIQPGSILEKAGFKENDVITQVNSVVLEAEKGFALYQALRDEKVVRVNILRGGKTPTMIVIKIK